MHLPLFGRKRSRELASTRITIRTQLIIDRVFNGNKKETTLAKKVAEFMDATSCDEFLELIPNLNLSPEEVYHAQVLYLQEFEVSKKAIASLKNKPVRKICKNVRRSVAVIVFGALIAGYAERDSAVQAGNDKLEDLKLLEPLIEERAKGIMVEKVNERTWFELRKKIGQNKDFPEELLRRLDRIDYTRLSARRNKQDPDEVISNTVADGVYIFTAEVGNVIIQFLAEHPELIDKVLDPLVEGVVPGKDPDQ